MSNIICFLIGVCVGATLLVCYALCAVNKRGDDNE
jgi:hypothetical protein